MKVAYKLLLISIILTGLWLRLSYLTSTPPSLHGDELGAGYNAYLLLLTGRDEYQKLLPLTFRNDFSPLIFYATIPFVAVFGLSEIAIRLPSAIVGVSTLLFVYLICHQLFKNTKISLLAIYLMAFSTWHLRSSRVALEMIWALFFQLIALFFFLKWIKSTTNKSLSAELFFSFVFCSFSIFSYQSAKLTTPLFIIFLIFIFRQKLNKKRIKFIILLFFLFIIPPLIIYPLVRPVSQWRFAGISVFTVWKSTLPKGAGFPSPSAVLTLGRLVIINYFKHFHPKLLFFDNSNLRYFQLSHFGLYYPWQSVFIIVGLLLTLRQMQNKENQLLLLWLLISPLPASLTTGVPTANIGRNLMMLPTLEILTARGLLQVGKYLHHLQLKPFNQLFKLVMMLIVIFSVGNFLHQYLTVEPKKSAVFWGKPYKEAMLVLKQLEKTADKIVITNSNPQSYIYLLFYLKKSPQWLFTQPKERAEVVGYKKIGKYEFRPINIPTDKLLPNSLLIGTTKEIPATSQNIIEEIRGNDDDEVYLRIIRT